MNYRVPMIVLPSGELVSPSSCGIIWVTDGEERNWAAADRDPRWTLGEVKRLFGAEALKLANVNLGPAIAEAFRDESATEPAEVLYNLFLKDLTPLELAMLRHTLEDRWLGNNFADGREGPSGQAVAALLEKLTEWCNAVGVPPVEGKHPYLTFEVDDAETAERVCESLAGLMPVDDTRALFGPMMRIYSPKPVNTCGGSGPWVVRVTVGAPLTENREGAREMCLGRLDGIQLRRDPKMHFATSEEIGAWAAWPSAG